MTCLAAACQALVVSQALVVGEAQAAQWHPNLAAGQAASAATGRPVLAVVSVRWAGGEAAALEQVLTSPEADAVINACFEPVRIDADTDLEFVRRAGIAHVPTGCIVAADGTVLTVFELPTSNVEFVAAVARLARQYPNSSAEDMTGHDASPRDLVAQSAPPRSPPAGTAIGAANVPSPFAGTGLVEDVPSPRGSISLVTTKLRRLSNFASDAEPPRGAAPALGVADHPLPVRQSAADALPQGLASTASAEEPHMPSAPPGWPAERTGPLAPSGAAAPPRPTIEPAGTSRFTSAAPSAPWLDVPEAGPSVDPWGRPVATAPVLPPSPPSGPPLAAAPGTVTAAPGTVAAQTYRETVSTPEAAAATAPAPMPGTPPAADGAAAPSTVATLPDRAAEEAPPPSRTSSLFAALQKPFTSLWGQSPATPAPPTLPPARPQRPLDAPSTASAVTTTSTGTTEAVDVSGSMPLGLEGYCPVTLVDQGTWAEGRVQWGARHRGRTYLFAGPEQQATFLANPDRYAPALSGDDPVLAMESGVSTPGQRRYGVTYQSRMYLFTSSETRATFAANPARYSAAVLLAERGQQVADGTRRY